MLAILISIILLAKEMNCLTLKTKQMIINGEPQLCENLYILALILRSHHVCHYKWY